MKKVIPFSSFNSNATTKKSALLLLLLSSRASESSKKIKMSSDKPDGFCFRWTGAHRRCILQPECQLCESLRKLEIHKPTLNKDLTPLDQLATTPDPPPLGPDPGRGPDFPAPPIPDIPLKRPRSPPPKPPDEVPPQTPPKKVPPPDHPPGGRPPAPPDI